jgi:2-dehydro-3-deoxyphosphogluconate aldolase/(4S)-4-hydroxy-2-oxoglutarate aldolase
MNREQGLAQLEQTRMIGIVRGVGLSDILPVAEALLAGGMPVMEITLNSDGALASIAELQEKMGDRMYIGAGTVLDMNDAVNAIKAGASFIVTPNTDEDVIRYASGHQIPVFPGALTPTEIVRAWKAGATAVKLFPSASLGLSYFKELQGPLSHIPMLAVGGISPDNVEDFLKAGCYGFGVGGSVIQTKEIAKGNYQAVEEAASRLTNAVKRYLLSS